MSASGEGALNPGDYTLLVVDDVEENRDMLSRRLERKGFQVLSADTGPRALSIVEEHPVDLVILDVMMPKMSGLDVLESLRARAQTESLPVIMATARADSDDVVEALGLGANDYVTKPIDFPVLVARVHAALRPRRASSQGEAREVGPGTEIGGRYIIRSRVGEGGFGFVYRARQRGLERDVAIKVLHKAHLESEALERFRQEGMHACRVRHPNALVILDSGVTEGGLPYLVMEYLEGGTLEDEMNTRPIPFVRSAEIMSSVCGALSAAHELGIVHRDIKPANIFLHQGAQGVVPKVLDFGIAKLVRDPAAKKSMTLEGSLIGTPAFMAPERVRNQPYDGKSDVYAVGIILAQLLTGMFPFASAVGGHTPEPIALAMMHTHEPPVRLRVIDPRVPESLDAVVSRCLKKDPGQRPTAEELAVLLRDAVAGIPADARGESASVLMRTKVTVHPDLQSGSGTGDLPTMSLQKKEGG